MAADVAPRRRLPHAPTAEKGADLEKLWAHEIAYPCLLRAIVEPQVVGEPGLALPLCQGITRVILTP